MIRPRQPQRTKEARKRELTVQKAQKLLLISTVAVVTVGAIFGVYLYFS